MFSNFYSLTCETFPKTTKIQVFPASEITPTFRCTPQRKMVKKWKITILVKLWENRARRLVNGFARNPRQNFGNFVKISNFFWIFWFLTIFGRVVHLNVGGDFRCRKNMNFGCFRKSFTGQGRKIRKHLTSVSESLNIIKKSYREIFLDFRSSGRFFHRNVDFDFWKSTFQTGIWWFWWILLKLWQNAAPALVNGSARNPRENFGNFVKISNF